MGKSAISLLYALFAFVLFLFFTVRLQRAAVRACYMRSCPVHLSIHWLHYFILNELYGNVEICSCGRDPNDVSRCQITPSEAPTKLDGGLYRLHSEPWKMNLHTKEEDHPVRRLHSGSKGATLNTSVNDRVFVAHQVVDSWRDSVVAKSRVKPVVGDQQQWTPLPGHVLACVNARRRSAMPPVTYKMSKNDSRTTVDDWAFPVAAYTRLRNMPTQNVTPQNIFSEIVPSTDNLFTYLLTKDMAKVKNTPATEALPQQGLVCGTVCHRIYATKKLSFRSFRRLLKTHWFTADHSAMWTIIYCAIEIYLLTYLLCNHVFKF